MDVIHGKQTKNGVLAYERITEVKTFTRQDDVILKGFPRPMSVIRLIRRDRSSYPMVFPNKCCRDRAFQDMHKREGDVIVLDYIKYFTFAALKDKEAAGLIGVRTLGRHLRECMRLILKEVSMPELLRTDAFNEMNITEAQNILNNTYGYIPVSEKIKDTWMKTLYIPTELTRVGVSHSQFINTIINNESKTIIWTDSLITNGDSL